MSDWAEALSSEESVNFPAAGRNEFDGVAVGVAKIDAVAASRAIDFAFDGDTLCRKVIAPGLYV